MAVKSLEDLQLESHISTRRETSIGDISTSNERFYPLQARSDAVEKFHSLVQDDLIGLHCHNKTLFNKSAKDNLTYKEKAAISSLNKNRDLLVRQTDKGGAVIVMSNDLYFQINKKMLMDQKTYRLLTFNPTEKFDCDLHQILLEDLSFYTVYQSRFLE